VVRVIFSLCASMTVLISSWAWLLGENLYCSSAETSRSRLASGEIAALMMNLGGDCGPDVEHCGETARALSFVVLGLGVAVALFLIVRFVRTHRR